VTTAGINDVIALGMMGGEPDDEATGGGVGLTLIGIMVWRGVDGGGGAGEADLDCLGGRTSRSESAGSGDNDDDLDVAGSGDGSGKGDGREDGKG
jgi:hypothetical protein